jgi:hypothetical protein
LRADLICRELAVAVFVEFFQRLARGLNLIGRELAIMVFVERFEEGAARRRRRPVAIGTAPSFGGLSAARRQQEKQRSDAQ